MKRAFTRPTWRHFEVASRQKMPYSAPPMPEDPIEAYYADYVSGRSLFAQSFKFTIDHPMLWTFFVYLLMFMIVVDTCQRIALRFAGDDRCWIMFVNRCISELMMFGAVAISILLVDEFMRKEMPYIRKDQIHWVDVFCSISACLLILVGYWAFVLVVRPREHYRQLMQRNDEASLDFIVFGGKITRQLAEDYGLREVYDFGDYVREITGQLIAELIDVNMVTWALFAVPPTIGVIATHVNEERAVRVYASDADVNVTYEATYQDGGPTPDAVAVEILLGIGWLWFAMSLALEWVVIDAMRQLRVLYGFNDAVAAKRALDEIESTPLLELRGRRTSLEHPDRRTTLEGGEPRPRLHTSPASCGVNDPLDQLDQLATIRSGDLPGAAEEGTASGAASGAVSGARSFGHGGQRQKAATGSGRRLVGGAELTGAVTGAAPKDEAKRRTSNVPVCNERSAASTDFALKAELLSRNLQRQATSKNQTNGELLHHSDASEDALPCPKANIWAARHLDLLKELLQARGLPHVPARPPSPRAHPPLAPLLSDARACRSSCSTLVARWPCTRSPYSSGSTPPPSAPPGTSSRCCRRSSRSSCSCPTSATHSPSSRPTRCPTRPSSTTSSLT